MTLASNARFIAIIDLLALGACGINPATAPTTIGAEFRDCEYCPVMKVLPSGKYAMGSPETEEGRLDHESPQHTVTIDRQFAVSKFEVTVGQYAAFISASGHASGDSCTVWTGKRPGATLSGKNWRDPNFNQTDVEPVVCINWRDAKAYVSWLTLTTGESYRLLSEAEWEYAARAGTATRYYFGDDDADICDYANVPDQSAKADIGEDVWKYASCDDGYGYATAPVGSFKPNAFGLYDMHGNVWEWTEDCYHPNFIGAPTNGSAWITEDCDARVVRGASLSAPIRHTRSASRYLGIIEIPNAPPSDGMTYHNFNLGLRVARDL